MRPVACNSFEHILITCKMICAKICAAMPADKNEANHCFPREPSQSSLYQVFARSHMQKCEKPYRVPPEPYPVGAV